MERKNIRGIMSVKGLEITADEFRERWTQVIDDALTPFGNYRAVEMVFDLIDEDGHVEVSVQFPMPFDRNSEEKDE